MAWIIRRGAEELKARAAPAGPEDAGRGLREVPARIIVAFSISFNFFPPFATFGCGDPQIISTSLARHLDLHLLFCAGDAFWLDCAPAYVFFPPFFSLIPTRLYFFFEFPALVPLRAAGVALISELIDSSVIGFISYPLLEVVKPLKARQEWFLKVYF